jgi:hypothetical protein
MDPTYSQHAFFLEISMFVVGILTGAGAVFLWI